MTPTNWGVFGWGFISLTVGELRQLRIQFTCIFRWFYRQYREYPQHVLFFHAKARGYSLRGEYVRKSET